MKRKVFFLLILAFLPFTMVLQAQAPQAVTLQSVLRDAAGRLVANRNVSVLISLRRGSNTGTVVYSETHTPTTNQNGLYTVFFGRGTAVTGTFAGIDWTQGPYYATVEADPNGGSNYTLTVSHPIVSVPYALYAEQTNEMQVLAYSNDTLYLRGGNTTTWVYLPAGGGGGGGCVPTCGKVDTIRHQLDSIINLACIATVHYVAANGCDSYTWSVNGQTYTGSGVYTYTRARGNTRGCDSIEMLMLTINRSTHNVVNESAVGFYNWHGTAYSTSGTYVYSYNNAVGCASADTLKLKINTVGSLPGEFTVSSSGKKIRFSRGNLQFLPSTREWRFAGQQYTCIGNNASNNTRMDQSRSTSGSWMDLFGWGTSYVRVDGEGYNTKYEPWNPYSTGSNGTYNAYGYGPSTNMISADLTGGSDVADWGVANRISNGGYRERLWRTPTSAEWNYLFETRTTRATGLTAPNSTNNNARFCHATVVGVPGIILFPDSYTHPESSVSIQNLNANGAYASNNILATSWTAMEAAGAVFLPACGFRGYPYNNRTDYNPPVNNVNDQGRYWSSTHKDQTYAFFLYFLNAGHTPQNNTERYYGLSVRLIQDVN